MPRGVRVGKDPWQRERAGFTCSCSIWPWKRGWDGSSCAQGQGAGLRVLVSRGGVWVMPERSSTALCWAVGWGCTWGAPGGALSFAAKGQLQRVLEGWAWGMAKKTATTAKLSGPGSGKAQQIGREIRCWQWCLP